MKEIIWDNYLEPVHYDLAKLIEEYAGERPTPVYELGEVFFDKYGAFGISMACHILVHVHKTFSSYYLAVRNGHVFPAKYAAPPDIEGDDLTDIISIIEKNHV